MKTIRCKICAAPIKNTSILKNSRVFYNCDDCGFISLDSRFYLSSDQEKARYDLHENSSENSDYIKLLEDFMKAAVEPYSVQKILDYGSGPNPVLAKLLRERGYEVDIYDPYYAPWDPSNNSSYDMIVSTETFEHFRDPLKEFQRIKNLLKPQAYLAIMTSFACNHEEFKAWRYKDDETHISFYSMQSFRKLAELFDLGIIYNNDKNIVVLRG